MNRRTIAAALLAASALTLTACGEPVRGTVTHMEYDKAETKHTTRQDCTTKTTGAGTSKRTSRTCKTVPTTKHEPEEWELTIREADGDEREVDVSERVYKSLKVGDTYDSSRK